MMPNPDQREASGWLGEVLEASFLSYQLDSVERPGAVKGALILRGEAAP